MQIPPIPVDALLVLGLGRIWSERQGRGEKFHFAVLSKEGEAILLRRGALTFRWPPLELGAAAGSGLVLGRLGPRSALVAAHVARDGGRVPRGYTAAARSRGLMRLGHSPSNALNLLSLLTINKPYRLNLRALFEAVWHFCGTTLKDAAIGYACQTPEQFGGDHAYNYRF